MIRLPTSLLATSLLATGLFAAVPNAAQAQAPAPVAVPATESGEIAVRGEGRATAAPDLATLNLTVLRVADTAEAALDQSNEAAGAVLGAMEGFGIEARDRQTSGFSITPQYRYENREDGTSAPPQIVGYEARNSLTVRVRDLARLGEILDRAVSLGVNQGGDIAFSVEDPTALRNDARRQAVERARDSATTLAEAAGVTLGRVVRITDLVEGGIALPMPQMRAMSADASSVPIAAGESEISTQVLVVFEIVGDNASAD